MSSENRGQPIIGEAPAFLEMLEHVSRAAPLSKPVLVVGERGTGKELIASRLHFLSRRWEQPLIKVNCAALTESILESELFGHEAGAFTGAVRAHMGHFERANGGTLVLDELASISLRMQEKILRVIEYGELQRVGGSDTISVEVRIVGSTNADLQALVATGNFREDLLDRLAFDVVTVPPLRERLDDILPLAYAFALNMASELQLRYFPGFGARASSALLRHDWPGNVRELKNAVDSPFRLRESATVETSGKGRSVIRSTPILPTNINARVNELELELLKAGLEKARFNQRVAADLLGLSYHQLRGKIRKHSLDMRKIETANS
jgi:psp operon transcriptional activator